MILEAADRAGRDAKTGKGGTVEYLTAQAKENPQAFMSLLGKVLPKDLNVRIDPLDEMTDDQLRAYIVRSLGDLGPFLTLGSGEAGSEGEGATRH